MTKNLLTLFFIFLASILYSQEFEISHQLTLGGSADDVLNNICLTEDGGYLAIGSSFSSNSGLVQDETNSPGFSDAWIVKLNSELEIEWQKLIGGDATEEPNALISLSNGGFLVGMASGSGISGDKTVENYGTIDYWVMELDSNGNIVWQEVYGGDSNDIITQIIPYEDNFLLIGESYSGISGIKTEESNGGADHWVVCINPSGDLLWEKSFGGPSLDFSQSAFIRDDQFLFLSGTSWSGIGGDKTEDKIDSSHDFWVLKIDLQNNFEVVWDRTLGGSGFEGGGRILQHNYSTIVVCSSPSDASGNKTQDSLGENDLWILALNDNGEILWDRTIGGSSADNVAATLLNENNHLTIFSRSASDMSEFKSEDSRGFSDFWVVDFNLSTLFINWEKTIGGNSIEGTSEIVQFGEDQYALAGYSISDISGEKTENSYGEGDYWIMTIDAPLAVDNLDNWNQTNVFPNPIIDYIYIDNKIDASALEIYSIDGKKLDRILLNKSLTNPQEIIIELNSGIYHFILIKDQTPLKNFQILVQ